MLSQPKAILRIVQLASQVQTENLVFPHSDFKFLSLHFVLSEQSLECRKAHDTVVVVEDWIHGQPPSPIASNPKDIGQRDGFIGGCIPCVGGFALQPINGPDTGQDRIQDGNEHAGSKKECPKTQQGHGAHQLHLHYIEFAIL